jgi:hypothetical protein
LRRIRRFDVAHRPEPVEGRRKLIMNRLWRGVMNLCPFTSGRGLARAVALGIVQDLMRARRIAARLMPSLRTQRVRISYALDPEVPGLENFFLCLPMPDDVMETVRFRERFYSSTYCLFRPEAFLLIGIRFVDESAEEEPGCAGCCQTSCETSCEQVSRESFYEISCQGRDRR